MILNDAIGKVMYIIDEDMYYYFAMVSEELGFVFYGSWYTDEMPENRSNRAEIWSWDKFMKGKDDKELKLYHIEDFGKECSSINQHLIKSLFTGWLL